jgi:fused signal recognition particle receptor
LFVGDALAGNDAVSQAEEFSKSVRIDGSVLTKIDADAKGGAAVSIAYVTKKPILYVGTGQMYDDLEPFKPEVIVDRILATS